MKIINNRVVCTGCEEPFEVGQKIRSIQLKAEKAARIDHIGIPEFLEESYIKNREIFHEGCD